MDQIVPGSYGPHWIPSICNPSSPQEKGNDEQIVGYIRRNVFSIRDSLESLIEAQIWLKNTWHYSTQKRINKYSLIKFENNFYSVPDDFPSLKISIKVHVDRIDLYTDNSLIATHLRLYGKDQYSLDILHYLKTLGRKPGTVKNPKALAQLHDQLQDMFHRYYDDRSADFLKILSLIRETSLEGLLYAIQHLKENGISPEYEVIRMIVHQQPVPMIEPLMIEDLIRVNDPDLSVYP